MISDAFKNISGQIAGINLSSFLQMIEMEQKTCTVKVFTRKDVGYVYFLKGVLIDAETTKTKALEALFTILSWQNIIIEVKKNQTHTKNQINLPLMHVLIESAQYSDESAKQKGDAGQEKIKKIHTKTIELQQFKGENFCLDTGTRLLIDFQEPAVSFRSTLVGVEFGKYLLLKAPGLMDLGESDFFKGNELVAKSLHKGTIYAFRSKLLDIISNPMKLMFIEYPQRVEHHELRSHQRFKCSIIAQTKIKERERNGVIENISRGGCLCIVQLFSNDENLPGDLLNSTISFKCRFPGSQNDINVFGEIKNTRQKSDEMAVGVKFIYSDSPDTVQSVISDYIQLIEFSGIPV